MAHGPAVPHGTSKGVDNPPNTDAAVRSQMRRRTRRSFLVAGAAAIGGYGFWRWIANSPEKDGLSAPLRQAENFNAAVSRKVLGVSRMARTYPLDRAVRNVRVNGDLGLDTDLLLPTWRLQVVGLEKPHRYRQYVNDVSAWQYRDADDDGSDDADSAPPADSGKDDTKNGPAIHIDTPPVTVHAGESEASQPGLLLSMADIRQLPRVEMVTQLKCIEGWSEIVHWGGVRMVDFIRAYKPARGADGSAVRFVGLETPDGDYYVGLDMPTAMHPQTLLCYEINGQPLSPQHGAPLRLVTPMKYGIKNLKQIGRITFTNVRPKDYWAEQGYDWYSGL